MSTRAYVVRADYLLARMPRGELERVDFLEQITYAWNIDVHDEGGCAS